jgi:hypothetical protein
LSKPQRRERAALRVECRARRAMYGKINATVTDHFFVGGVYDGIDLHFRDVLSDDLKRHSILLVRSYSYYNTDCGRAQPKMKKQG